MRCMDVLHEESGRAEARSSKQRTAHAWDGMHRSHVACRRNITPNPSTLLTSVVAGFGVACKHAVP